jgi:hypothetical protein
MSSKKISPTLESLNTFFKTLGFVAFYAAVIPFVITWWFSGSLPQAIAMAFGFSILAIILFCGTVKSQIVKSVGVPHMFQIDINEYPQLNHTSLENYTQSLEALGFKYLGDLGSRLGESLSMVRVFWHSTHNCFTEVGQNFCEADPNKDISMRCCFGSLLKKSAEKQWALGTSNMVEGMSGISYMMRRPNSLWQNFPEYGIDDVQKLLRNHLELRNAICSSTNIEIQANRTLESYIHHEEDESVQRYAALEKRNILVALIEAYIFELNPKSEWLGDYTKFAAKSSVNSPYVFKNKNPIWYRVWGCAPIEGYALKLP